MRRHELKSGAVARARNLRRAATPEERILWQTLRRNMTTAKFRRQVPMGPYFADFVSHGAKLVIELDGAQHAQREDYDADRTRFLQGEGYRVLRFWNRDVKENLDGVFQIIEAALKQSPSPLVGEGGPKDRMRGAQHSCAPASGRHPSPQPSPTGGEGDSVNLSVGV